MVAQKYTLFPPDGPCDEPLPAHMVKDEFVFVQLAPLEAMQDGEPAGDLTIPKDVLFPERVAQLKATYPEVPYAVIGKGPGIWLKKWRTPVGPRPGGYPPVIVTDVPVDDVYTFISKPLAEVGAGGRSRRVLLDNANIQDLLGGEPTLARLQSAGGKPDETPDIVRLLPAAPPPPANPSPIVADIPQLLAARSLNVDGYDYPVTLTAENVAELAQGGVTVMKIGSGKASTSITVMNRELRPEFPTAELTGAERRPMMAMMGSTVTASPSKSAAWMKGVPANLLSEPSAIAERLNTTFYAVGTLALYLPYRVTWELLGYTRGELLHTISLAPEETTTIELTTWDRRREEAETSDSFESQSASEASFNAKLTAEAVNGLTHKHDWGLNVHGDVSIPIQAAKVGVGGAWNDTQGIQDTHDGSVTLVREGLTKVSSQIKTTHQTRVTQSRETGFDRKNTRQIKNANMCHTLDLDYFEILASYEVSMVPLVDQARVCLLVKNPIRDRIDPRFLLTYESELRASLLAPEHDKGFAAARMLAALGHVHDYECILHCPEPCPCDEPPPATGTGEAAPAVDPVQQALADIATVAAAIRESITRLSNADVYRDHVTDGTHTPSSGICALARDIFNFGHHPNSEWDEAIDEWRCWLFREVHLKRHATGFWSECLRYIKTPDDTPGRMERLLKQAEVGWATALNQAVAAILSSIQVTGLVVDLTLACTGNIKPLLDHAGFDDGGLDGATKQAGSVLEAYNSAKAAAAASKVVEDAAASGAAIVGAGQPESASWPYQPKDLAEARVAQDALLAHILTHECYYRQAVWASLGADDRLLILRLMNDLPRSVEPQVLGFMADDCALPLRLDQFPDIAAWLQKNVVHNAGLLAAPVPFTVTLPTSGVSVETSLGQCSTCEDFIEEHRTLDLAQKAAEVDLAKERVEQEKLETQRYQARLTHTPHALLDDPDPGEKGAAIHVIVDKPAP